MGNSRRKNRAGGNNPSTLRRGLRKHMEAVQMSTNKIEIRNSFIELLKINPHLDDNKIDSLIFTRLVRGLELTKTCPRCGGSGRYSWNQRDGDMCLKCFGYGVVNQPLTKKLLTEAQSCVDAGMLTAYFERIAIENKGKKCLDNFSKLWKQISVLYDWHKAAEKVSPDREIADINSEVYDMYNQLEKLISSARRKSPQEKNDIYKTAADKFDEFKPIVEKLIEQAKDIQINYVGTK
jgi:hypothetical protein